MEGNFRIERDLLGAREVPAHALYGIHTVRAQENFVASGRPVNRRLVHAYALVKKACAITNGELGFLSTEVTQVVCAACDELASGALDKWIICDALQGGAGTSTNMNVNEVLANRALQLLGNQPGDYRAIHPLDTLNLHQSTNDTYPTALKVAMIRGVRELSQEAAALQGVLQRHEKRFAAVVMIGRTEYAEAVPMTLGSVFSGYAEALARDRWRTFKCEERLRVVNLGGTAVGTALTAPRRYLFQVTDRLRELTGFGLTRAENLIEQTANVDSLVEVSAILKAVAADISKLADDLRLLALLGEIRIPAVQVGSSMMPGKINPVILESAIQIGIKVRANDSMVAECASRGTLQICEFLPLLADALLESLDLLRCTLHVLAGHLENIEVEEAVCRRNMDRSPALVTALLPELGYDRATGLAAEFVAAGGGNMRDFLSATFGARHVEEALSPERLMGFGETQPADHTHKREGK